jgi:hypothetical protein
MHSALRASFFTKMTPAAITGNSWPADPTWNGALLLVRFTRAVQQLCSVFRSMCSRFPSTFGLGRSDRATQCCC